VTPDVLFHFSEDPTIEVFHPHVAATQQVEGAWVWADDEKHSPRYWFPRDCPRATWWAKGDPTRDRVHVIEQGWYDRFVTCVLYAYRLPGATFEENPEGGGWRSPVTVRPLGVGNVGPLLEKHRDAGIDLRVVSDGELLALWDDVITREGIDFSGIRLRNAITKQGP
jgi:hypothetical protein